MKWIKPRNLFLEAKLRDVLLEPQKKRLVHVWGEKYLDYEEIKATDKIKQGRWKLSEEDKDRAINEFFSTDYRWVKDRLNALPDRFVETIKKCISMPNIENNSGLYREHKDKIKKGFDKKDFNIRNPQVLQIACFNLSMFSLINSSETKSDSRVEKGEDGRPLRNEDGSIKKVKKEVGELVIGTNFGNIGSFATSYNNAYPDEKIDINLFTHRNIQNIINMVDDNPDCGDFDLFGNHELYLLVNHNAVDILNMSVSKFYKSCQELYFGGGHGTSYMKQLLMNVFDPNTVPAFLVFDTPYYTHTETGKEPEKVSDALPLCRLLLRNIEPFDSDESSTIIYFDKTYPDRMNECLSDMIEKYSENKKTHYRGNYYFYPDVDSLDVEQLQMPYMDHLSLRPGLTIGKNTKALYLSRNYDWSTTVISKEANIKELIIETDNIPSNFFKIKMMPEWVKFKYIKINDLSKFSNILTDSLSFYQCKLNSKDFISDLYKISPGIKKLSFGSVDIGNLNGLKSFSGLEELELIYTISGSTNLEKLIDGINIKKLTLSGDMVKSDINKEYIKKLQKSGVTVLLKGLVL